MGKQFDLASLAKEEPFKPPAFHRNDGQAAESTESTAYRQLPIETVTTNPLNERPVGEDEEIAELAATIKECGTIQPLVVCSVRAFLSRYPGHRSQLAEAEWVTLIGNRRLLASRRAGRAHVPALLDDDRVGSMHKAMLIENVQRRDMPPLHEAKAMVRAMEEESLSQRDLAKQIGKTHGFVSQRLALLKLIPALRNALEEGDLTLEVARTFGDLAEDEQRQIVAAGKPYRRPSSQTASATQRGWASSPTRAASSIQKKFSPTEMAELVQLLAAHLESLAPDPE